MVAGVEYMSYDHYTSENLKSIGQSSSVLKLSCKQESAEEIKRKEKFKKNTAKIIKAFFAKMP